MAQFTLSSKNKGKIKASHSLLHLSGVNMLQVFAFEALYIKVYFENVIFITTKPEVPHLLRNL